MALSVSLSLVPTPLRYFIVGIVYRQKQQSVADSDVQTFMIFIRFTFNREFEW